ncbi:MAG: glycosyltransferase [Chitinophagales bacterium]|nr:glycosyltransferase [Chitinophagales bacterium]MDW8273748.1 glycosyltransferase [Chitinophagales bacterium]
MKIFLIDTSGRDTPCQWAQEWKAHSRHNIVLFTPDTASSDSQGDLSDSTFINIHENFDLGDFDAIVVCGKAAISSLFAKSDTHLSKAPMILCLYENSFFKYHLESHHQYATLFDKIVLAHNVVSIWFNSQYQKIKFREFLSSILSNLDIREKALNLFDFKANVLPPGLSLKSRFGSEIQENVKYHRCLVLWNQRWEQAKNPDLFFKTLITLAEHGIEFKLAVLGEATKDYPSVFDHAKEVLSEYIVQWGYVQDEKEYASWLWKADLLPVTAFDDNCLSSVIEAAYCNTVPLLPKRLAYPEILPAQYQHTFFYDDNEFAVKLQKRIMDVKYVRTMNTQQWVDRFDWNNIVKSYDDKIEELIRDFQ